MDVVVDPPADAQASERMKQGEGPLDHVTVFPQAGEQRADLQLADQVAAPVVVMAAVGEYDVRALMKPIHVRPGKGRYAPLTP
ncbi:hypothetical protein ACIA8R_12605 [Nonomuraea sp. NPDC051191]|uniref:hypothetical protein n=1 Tax=Nonomuraea sp. NPDC051191 TaxID=3364372 RepID=UPI0037B016EF